MSRLVLITKYKVITFVEVLTFFRFVFIILCDCCRKYRKGIKEGVSTYTIDESICFDY